MFIIFYYISTIKVMRAFYYKVACEANDVLVIKFKHTTREVPVPFDKFNRYEMHLNVNSVNVFKLSLLTRTTNFCFVASSTSIIILCVVNISYYQHKPITLWPIQECRAKR